LISVDLRPNTGEYWLAKLQGALPAVVKYMALNRYGQAPDADDRVSDALAALVEGSARFQPQPGKDGIGYYLQYTLAHVAGALRNGAKVAKGWSDEAACFTDVAPDELGIERLFETLPDEPADEAQFVLNNGQVAGATEIVELITSHPERRRIAAKKLGIQADDASLPERLLGALDHIEAELRAEPLWMRDVPEPAPVVARELAATYVTRHNRETGALTRQEVSGAEFAEMVEAASRQSAVWTPEDVGVQYETDVPWGSWAAEEETRSFRSAFADDNAWPDEASQNWRDLVLAWSLVSHADDVMDALLGSETEIPESAQYAVEQMEALAEALADVTDGQARTVARALARRIVHFGVQVRTEPGELPTEALSDSLAWFLGVDNTGGWDAELPSADGLKHAVSEWVGKVTAARGVWKSQAAAIKALVLQRADPRAAKAAAQAAFSRA
jgi:hypothetical protein